MRVRLEHIGRFSTKCLGGGRGAATILWRPASHLSVFKAINHTLKGGAVNRWPSHRIRRTLYIVSKKGCGLASKWNYTV